DDLRWFEHLEAVPAEGQQDHVSRGKFGALQVLPSLRIEVDANASTPDQEDFLRVLHLPANRVVDVWWNDVTGGPVHVAKLLGVGARGEEVDAFTPEIPAHDQRQLDVSVDEALDHFRNSLGYGVSRS